MEVGIATRVYECMYVWVFALVLVGSRAVVVFAEAKRSALRTRRTIHLHRHTAGAVPRNSCSNYGNSMWLLQQQQQWQ